MMRFNTEVPHAISDVSCAIGGAVHQRLAGVEAPNQLLATDASEAAQAILTSATNELGATNASLTILRGEVTQEATAVRITLSEARVATELIYVNTRAEFLNIQAEFHNMKGQSMMSTGSSTICKTSPGSGCTPRWMSSWPQWRRA